MAGAGNDFIMIDAQKGLNYKSLAKKVCDRTSGIGADGLIILDKPKQKYDYKMRIINADGSEAEMCGNGSRCAAHFAVRVCGLGEPDGEVTRVRFRTDSGPDVAVAPRSHARGKGGLPRRERERGL